MFLKVGPTKKESKLELVHFDVWGPAQISSLGGSSYYVTFIDDATRKVWVYCIRNKSDAFDTYVKWKSLVENETGLKLKCLRSDNGGEYCSNEFDDYYSKNGIRRKKTVPGTLQVFGCEVFVHIDKDDRTKLEAKSEKCTFIGYGGDDFEFKCWSIKEKKIIRSRDVVFNEKVMYNQQLQENREESKKEYKKEYAVVEDLLDGKVTHESVQEPPQQEPQTPILRRSSRVRREPKHFSPSLYYLLLTDSEEPGSSDEAMQVNVRKKWEQAMDEEHQALMENQTWDLVKLPKGKRALQNKWVFRVKEEEGGKKRYKARLVVKGFAQKKGIDFDEIFSPVVKMTSIRTVLGIVAAEDLLRKIRCKDYIYPWRFGGGAIYAAARRI
ncbi:hypothetical protein KI387_044109 [Taxus chinensis]|uniref:Integrase catalytic domain-containing protein n=2 Tax=Taxus chinensis TaxID=29808 RepID=A0AA38CEJ6_TAXCH|nr:hypothetical protein KI387_044109 [Taxus chinensis]